MISDLQIVQDLFFKSLHQPSLISNIANIAFRNQANAFMTQKISEVIIQSIYQTRPEDKLYGLFVLDILLKTLGPNYLNLFASQIIGIFIDTFVTVNNPVKQETLLFLRRKWSHFFPNYVLDRLDYEMARLIPNVSQIRKECQTQNIAEKRSASNDLDQNSKSKVAYQGITQPPNTALYKLKPGFPIPNMNLPPMKMPLNPSMMFPPPNVFPPNMYLNNPMMSNTMLPKPLNDSCPPKDLKCQNKPSSLYEDTIYDWKPVEYKPVNVAQNNVESFPNLSKLLETITSIKLNLNNYSFTAFSKFNKEEVDKLYAGIPCKECGLRFRDIHINEFKEHMEIHKFKFQNPLIKRKYTPHFTQWIQAPNRMQSGNFENKVFQYPVSEGNEKDICKVCREGFDVKYDEEEESYMLQNAQFVNGSVYHPICISDIEI